MQPQLIKNLSEVQQRIAAAAHRSSRPTEAVRLIGVTKYVDVATTRAVIAAGCTELGENRPQVLWDKAQQLNEMRVNWHLIGHLQRNKVKRTIETGAMIHSVDSAELLDAINKAAMDSNRVARILLEINISGDDSKHGLKPGELPGVLRSAHGKNHTIIEGLMGMSGLESDPECARREFASLRSLAESNRNFDSENVQLRELSMGMSGDFEVAIEEGATMVRVGSLLFEGL